MAMRSLPHKSKINNCIFSYFSLLIYFNFGKIKCLQRKCCYIGVYPKLLLKTFTIKTFRGCQGQEFNFQVKT